MAALFLSSSNDVTDPTNATQHEQKNQLFFSVGGWKQRAKYAATRVFVQIYRQLILLECSTRVCDQTKDMRVGVIWGLESPNVSQM